MSDHVPKNNQVKAGHANTTGIKLKPVTGATELILEGAKAAVANSDMSDKVPDTDREMDLTFYDANGNVEVADPDGDISMENDTIMQSIENDDDASSPIVEPVSAETSLTSTYDGAADFDDLFSSDNDKTNASGGLDEDSASVAPSAPKLFNRGVRGNSVSLTKDSENSVSVENRAYYSEDDREDYEYDKYAFRQKRLRLKNKAQRSEKQPSRVPKGGKGGRMKDGTMVAFDATNQRCDDQSCDGDSEGRPFKLAKGGKDVCIKDGRIVAFNAADQRCDDQVCDGDSEERSFRLPKGGKGGRMKDGRIVAFDAANQRCDYQACDGDSKMP